MKKQHLIVAGAIAIALSSCNRQEGWRLEGHAPDGVKSAIIQSPTTYGGWYGVDTVEVKDGRYAFNLPRANSAIYRVDLGERTFYVPADSTETITLTADGIRTGSAEALLFNAVDSAITAGADAKGILLALDGNYSSTAAYYATRAFTNRTLLRAVANRYKEERPSDPRTAILFAEVQKLAPQGSETGQTQVIVADEISYYDIELMDRNGEMQKLSDVVENSPLAILAYVDFTDETTQAITRALGDAQSAGAAIYEIGFNPNQYLWADSANGLPWVCVYQSEAADKAHISQYAVGSFPTFFIFRNGEIVERLNDYTKLSETLGKHK